MTGEELMKPKAFIEQDLVDMYEFVEEETGIKEKEIYQPYLYLYYQGCMHRDQGSSKTFDITSVFINKKKVKLNKFPLDELLQKVEDLKNVNKKGNKKQLSEWEKFVYDHFYSRYYDYIEL